MSILWTRPGLFGDLMLNVRLIAVGKLRESYLQEGLTEYLKRLRPYAKTEIIEIPDEPDAALRAKEREGEKILSRVGPEDYLIALDRQGKQLSSPEFAAAIQEWELTGKKPVFVIGGSCGLAEAVLKRANERWSFSKLTFPHQLFRLMLVEQIYRAFKIARGEKYHK